MEVASARPADGFAFGDLAAVIYVPLAELEDAYCRVPARVLSYEAAVLPLWARDLPVKEVSFATSVFTPQRALSRTRIRIELP